jgi:hypothetical protein
MAQPDKKRQERSGIVLRVDITPEEHDDLKHLAIDRKTSVPKLIAEQVRAALARSKKRQSV